MGSLAAAPPATEMLMWFAAVEHGATNALFPRGPWRSRTLAEAALALWRERLGWPSEPLSRFVYGYSSRAQARASDISDRIGRRGRIE